MGEQRRFGLGERVKYAMDWPDLPDPAYTVAAGSCATVIGAPDGPREMYLVHLDIPIPHLHPQMSVAGRYLEAE